VHDYVVVLRREVALDPDAFAVDQLDHLVVLRTAVDIAAVFVCDAEKRENGRSVLVASRTCDSRMGGYLRLA
jgi:hypothetical protein